MSEKASQRKRAPIDEPGVSFNPLRRVYWKEGVEGRKAGSKVPHSKRKAKRRKK